MNGFEAAHSQVLQKRKISGRKHYRIVLKVLTTMRPVALIVAGTVFMISLSGWRNQKVMR